MSKRDFAPLGSWLSREEWIGSCIWLELFTLDKTSCKFVQGKGKKNIWTQRWVQFTVVVTGPVSSTLLLVTFHWPVKRFFRFSVQFSRSVVSDSMWPYGLQHNRLSCPSPTPGTCWNSCPSSWWWHPTISSSVVPFSSCLQCFPASGSFLMSQLFASVEYLSFSFSISPSNEYSGLISFRKSLPDLKITYWSWIISLQPPPFFFPPSSSSSFPFHSFPVSSWKLSSFQSSLCHLSLMPSESVHALNDGSSFIHWVQSIFPRPTQMSILSSGILPSLPCLGSPPPSTISLFPGSSQWLSNQFYWFWSLLLIHPHLSSQYALPSTKSNTVTSLLKTLPCLWAGYKL